MLLKAKFLQLADNQQLFYIHFQGVTGIQTLYMKIKQPVPAPGILLQILAENCWQQIKLSEHLYWTIRKKPLFSRECRISGVLPAKAISSSGKYIFVLYTFA